LPARVLRGLQLRCENGLPVMLGSAHGRGERAPDRVLPDAPVRQYVLSVPYELRLLLASRSEVLSAVMNCHTHLHIIVIDGVYSRQDGATTRFHFVEPPWAQEQRKLGTGNKEVECEGECSESALTRYRADARPPARCREAEQQGVCCRRSSTRRLRARRLRTRRLRTRRLRARRLRARRSRRRRSLVRERARRTVGGTDAAHARDQRAAVSGVPGDHAVAGGDHEARGDRPDLDAREGAA